MSGLCAAIQFAILRITLTETVAMIRCHLSSLMGRDKLNISDVARATSLNRHGHRAVSRDRDPY